MDRLGLEIAADAARLDVDDTRRAEGDRGVGGGHGDDRLVQAYGRRDALGKQSMTAQVVFGQRLLDEEQPEGVHGRKQVSVVARVGLVGVRLERHLRPCLAHGTDGIDVPARLDLELDAPVAGIDVRRDLLEERVEAARNSHGDTAVHLVAHRSQVVRERLPPLAQPRVQNGCLESRLGHGMALESAQAPMDLVRIEQSIGRHGGDEVLDEYVDRAIDVLVGVARPLHRDAFRPARYPVAHDLDEEHVPCLLRAE